MFNIWTVYTCTCINASQTTKNMGGYLNLLLILEQYLRYESKPLFGASPSRNVDCINALVKFAAVCSHIMPQEVIKKHCLRLLSGEGFTQINWS